MPAVTVPIPDDLAAPCDTPEALERALFEDFVTSNHDAGFFLTDQSPP